MAKIKLTFIWNEITRMKPEKWRDGLWLAMQYLEKDYEVIYAEPTDEIDPDSIILFWEAPCTTNHPINGIWYNKIRNLPNKKALLFAGGPIKLEWIQGFDHVFYESKINGDELRALGVSCSLAFGINEQIFKPQESVLKYDGIAVGTNASWKRQWLVGEALGDRGILIGRSQENDTVGFDISRKLGATVLDEMLPHEIVKYVNQSWTALQCADPHGGGQRVTLESMACNLPVICMEDSPKNREYVEESGCGIVTNPNKEDIRKAVEEVKSIEWGTKGRDYILSKWTGKHYSDNLKLWLESL